MSAELGLSEVERGGLTGFTYRIARALAELRDAWDIASEPEPIEAAISSILTTSIFRMNRAQLELMEHVLRHGTGGPRMNRLIATIRRRIGVPL